MDYSSLQRQLASLLEGQDYWLTNLSQFAALVNDNLSDINWVGFYLAAGPQQLKLGPFQGRVACMDIPFAQGVCGKAAREQTTQRVDDVHAFDGHIACDARSQSEIVIPMLIHNSDSPRLVGVLDIDSPSLNRFDLEDQQGLEALLKILMEATSWPENLI